MSRRVALLIGNTDYEDRGLAKLNSPERDLRELAGLLQDPQVGAFDEVVPLFNRPFADVYPAIAEFFADKQREDTLLLYFSGHGVLDDQGRLYLALQNTRLNRLSGSALPAHFLKDEMDRSRSKRQILLLDCCHSGAFGKGAKGAVGAQAITEDTFAGQGHERVVLTATDKTEMAWEGDQIVDKEMEMSLFTHYVVEGLKTGAADADGDGAVTPNELYNYVFDQVVAATHKQKPHCFVYDRGGELHLAHNPRPRPAQLPPQLQDALSSPYVATREEALRELARLLGGADRGRSLAAHSALQQIAQHDDSRRLASAAAQALAGFTGQPSAAQAPASAPRSSADNDPTATNPRLPVDRKRFAAEADSRDAYLKQRAEAAAAAKQEAEQEEQAKAEQEQAARPGQPPAARLPVDRERFAAEEASRDAYLKQRAEAAAAKKEVAQKAPEPPRLPVDRERFAAEEASRDAYLKQRAEAAAVAKPAPQPAAPALAMAARQPGLRTPVLLTSLGWAMGMAITISVISAAIGWVFFTAPLGGIIGGAFTAEALRLGRKSVRAWHLAAIALAWLICQILFAITVYLTPSAPLIGVPVVVVLWAAAGSLTAVMSMLGIGLDQYTLPKRLQVVALSAAAWGLSFPIGAVASIPVVAVLGNNSNVVGFSVVGLIVGAVAGAIGGGVMFWQLRSAAHRPA